MTAPRRLAAILAADVVGYSRLMGEDEAGTARAVAIATSTVTIFNDRFTSIVLKNSQNDRSRKFRFRAPNLI